MDRQNKLSATEKIMSKIDHLPDEEKLVVLREIKDKYFSEHKELLIKEDGPEYENASSPDFSDFLERKKAEYKEEEVNWMDTKKEWIEQLNCFMKKIDGWLEEQQKTGTLSVKEMDVTLQEEHLGEYIAPSRELSIGNKKIQIKPIGRLIIGARGRVDIYSAYERYILLYLQDRDWVYRKEADRGQLHRFTKENLERIIEDVL